MIQPVTFAQNNSNTENQPSGSLNKLQVFKNNIKLTEQNLEIVYYKINFENNDSVFCHFVS